MNRIFIFLHGHPQSATNQGEAKERPNSCVLVCVGPRQ